MSHLLRLHLPQDSHFHANFLYTYKTCLRPLLPPPTLLPPVLSDLLLDVELDADQRPSCDMKLVELLDRASQGYPDQYLREYYDRETGKRKRGSGDGLAEFIAVELSETFDPDASEREQIDEGVRVLEGAIKELQDTIAALERET